MVLSVAGTLLLVVVGGCPQDPTQSGLGVPDSGQPSGDQLLEGPGFSLSVPSGFSLMEDTTSHPGTLFWRYYEDALGARVIAVQVLKPSPGGVTSLEDVSLRVKGATVTATRDFLLLSRIETGSFPLESEGAIGVLANGNILVVQIASLDIAGLEELIGLTLFTSINLEGTDGRELEERWRDGAPRLLAAADNDMIVLSDLSSWSLYADKTSEEVAEVETWSLGDAVFGQIVSSSGGVERAELVHVGNWRPVEVYRVGVATDATIAAIQEDAVSLSDETGWVVGVELASQWELGDQILRVPDLAAFWLIHAPTGRALLNPARVLMGPGFVLVLPNRALEEVEDLAAPAGTLFWKCFYDASEDVIYAASVSPPDDSGAGVTVIEEFSVRIRASVQSRSGDFLLLVRLSAGGFEGFEADMAIGSLADGDLLYVYLLAERIGATEELVGINLFTSVDLVASNGRQLETDIAGASPGLRVKASNGMLILDDRSVWSLPTSASPEENQEVESWAIGAKLFNQSYRDDFEFEDTYELVHVGNWVPVEVDYNGQATQLTIAEILEGDTLRLSDGSLYDFIVSVPTSWDVGDTVFRVRGLILSEWLIHEGTGLAIEFF